MLTNERTKKSKTGFQLEGRDGHWQAWWKFHLCENDRGGGGWRYGVTIPEWTWYLDSEGGYFIWQQAPLVSAKSAWSCALHDKIVHIREDWPEAGGSFNSLGKGNGPAGRLPRVGGRFHNNDIDDRNDNTHNTLWPPPLTASRPIKMKWFAESLLNNNDDDNWLDQKGRSACSIVQKRKSPNNQPPPANVEFGKL